MEMEMNVAVPLGFMGEGINTACHSTLAVLVSKATSMYVFQASHSDTLAKAETFSVLIPCKCPSNTQC